MSSVGGTSVPLSASAIVSPVEGSGSHILRIEGYSGTKGLGKGRHIDSETFAAGGHIWRLCYYPDSFSFDNYSDSITIALNLVDPDVENVEASFTVSLLDRFGDPVPSYCRSNRHTFATCVREFTVGKPFQYWNQPDEALSRVDLFERSDLEKSAHLKDDAFSVWCDVTVVNKAFTKRIPVSEALSGVVKQER